MPNWLSLLPVGWALLSLPSLKVGVILSVTFFQCVLANHLQRRYCGVESKDVADYFCQLDGCGLGRVQVNYCTVLASSQ